MWHMHQVWKRRRRSARWRLLGGAMALALLTLVAVPVASATSTQPAAQGTSVHAALPADTPGPGTPVSTFSPPVSTFSPPVIATPNALTPTPALPTTTAVPTLPPTTAPTSAPTPIPTSGTVTTATPTTGTPTPGGTPTTTPTGSASATATLGHVPTGTLSITYSPTLHLARTTMNVTGLAQGGAAVAVVLNGSCSAPAGIAWQGAPFTADANGKVSNFKVNYSKVNGIPTGAVVVGIQTVPGGNETRSNYLLACGPITSTGKNKGSVNLGPAPGVVDGAITGSATLAETNGTLVVSIKASGLQPGATNATALDLGSCQYQSYVLYDLPPMTADSSGNGQVSMTINNAEAISSSNNWYIAIDYNATINKSYFMTVGCGNVVVAGS
jgi:hypothetical protein